MLALRLIILVFLLAAQTAWCQNAARHLNLKDGVALEGYDPVSYFRNAPAKGKKDLRFTYNGATYLFSTGENLAEFRANPGRYEPAYGGWCAYAMGDSGEKVKVDPETYKIVDDRLYLFYNFWGNNTLKSWNKDESRLRAAADRNWDNLLGTRQR
jgi:YHS domain-containing protein